MKKKELYEDMNKQMAALVDQLRTQPHMELIKLPPYADQPRMFGKWEYKLATWRHVVDAQVVQIMVQAYYHHFFGIGTMMADGFRKSADGSIQEVPQDVRYEFI